MPSDPARSNRMRPPSGQSHGGDRVPESRSLAQLRRDRLRDRDPAVQRSEQIHLPELVQVQQRRRVREDVTQG